MFFARIIVSVEKDEEWYKLVTYTFLVIFFFCWPALIMIFLLQKFEQLDTPECKEKFAPLYLGINVKSPEALSYKSIFAIRRYNIICINIIFTVNSPVLGENRNLFLVKVILFMIV